MDFLKKTGIGIYVLILFVHCCFIFFELDTLRFYSKLLLVPFLLLLFLINFSGKKAMNKSFLLPILALTGSFAGDFFLAFEGAQFFLFGMLGFMVTHICNSIYFFSLYKLKTSNSKSAGVTLIILSITCSIVVFIIKENTGAFFIPIIIYMVLIAIMAILSTNLSDSKSYNHAAIHYFIPGASLFVLSDTLLALNKFRLQEPSLDVFVMMTYGLAQLFLVMGYYKVIIQTSVPSN